MNNDFEFTFEEVFQNQVEFQRMLNNDLESQEFKKQMFLGLFEEVAEMLKEVPLKAHKKNQSFNRENFLKEAVDVQLHLVNLLLSCDCDDQEFLKLLEEKQKINVQRQKTGY